MQYTTDKTPLAEMIIGSIGLVIVLSVIGYFVYAALQPQRPPQFSVEVLQTVKQPDGYLTEIGLYNKGDHTASDVIVTATIISEDASMPPETSEVLFPFSPSHSLRKAGFVFQNNPDQHTLRLQVKSYLLP